MTGPTAAMDTFATESFLESRRTGVLATTGGGESHPLPLSFAYDPEETAVYVPVERESRDRRALERADKVTFVVHDDDDGRGWRSVVVEGRVTLLSADPAVVAATEGVDLPTKGDGGDDVTVARIDATNLTSLRAGDGL